MTVMMEDKEEDVVIKEEELLQDKALEPKEVRQQVQDFWMVEEDEALTLQCHHLSKVMLECPSPRCQHCVLYTPLQCLLQAWTEQHILATCLQAFHALQETCTMQLQLHLQSIN